MDERRFDDLVRNLSVTGRSRRSVLKGLMASAVSGAVGLLSTGGALAGNNGKGNGSGNGNGGSNKPDCCPDSAPRLCNNQCVDFLTDSNNCGGCGNVCPDGSTCQNGACLCPTGTVLCGNSCVDTSTDQNNCGGCGNACGTNETCQSGHCVTNLECTPGATRSCYSGPAGTMGVGICTAGVQTCLVGGTWGSCMGEVLPRTETCNGLDDDCNGVIDDGFDLRNDVNNCGSCGHVCFTPNGVPGCANGECVIVACNPGFADCDGNAANGCEVDTRNDPHNCGGCNLACTMGEICVNGFCQPQCPESSVCTIYTFDPNSGTCVESFTAAGTPCGPSQVCDGAGSCVTMTSP